MKDYQAFFSETAEDIPAIEAAAIKEFTHLYPNIENFTEMTHKIGALITLELLRRYHDWTNS